MKIEGSSRIIREEKEAMIEVGHEIDHLIEINDYVLAFIREKVREESRDHHRGEGIGIEGILDLNRRVDCRVVHQVHCIHRVAQEIEMRLI